jgi:hypothetical protein
MIFKGYNQGRDDAGQRRHAVFQLTAPFTGVMVIDGFESTAVMASDSVHARAWDWSTAFIRDEKIKVPLSQ